MVEGSVGKACSSCHDSGDGFLGLRASMPRVNSAGDLETIPELINNCRTERMGAEKWEMVWWTNVCYAWSYRPAVAWNARRRCY